jgi:hypothetical protein
MHIFAEVCGGFPIKLKNIIIINYSAARRVSQEERPPKLVILMHIFAEVCGGFPIKLKNL